MSGLGFASSVLEQFADEEENESSSRWNSFAIKRRGWLKAHLFDHLVHRLRHPVASDKESVLQTKAAESHATFRLLPVHDLDR
jgi:hypothetical protein